MGAGVGLGHDDDRCGSVGQWGAVADGDAAVGPEPRGQGGEALLGHSGVRAVVGCGGGAVRGLDRDDVAEVEALVDGLLGEVVGAGGVGVDVGAGDAVQVGGVLGGQSHRDVRVRVAALFARVAPGPRARGPCWNAKLVEGGTPRWAPPTLDNSSRPQIGSYQPAPNEWHPAFVRDPVQSSAHDLVRRHPRPCSARIR